MKSFRYTLALWIAALGFVNIGHALSLENCPMKRITIPITQYKGKVTFAASFMHGEYAPDTTDVSKMFNSAKLEKQLTNLPADSKYQYPEYVVLLNFKYTKEGK